MDGIALNGKSRMARAALLVLLAFFVLNAAQRNSLRAADGDQEKPAEIELSWLTDYAEATEAAQMQSKMLLLFFHQKGQNKARDAFEEKTLANPEIRAKLSSYVLAKLPIDAEIHIDGQSTVLLKHSSFAEMLGRQGIVVIDYSNPQSKHYSHVVSTFPFNPGKYYSPIGMKVILNLPEGSLTQRTMIYAVRTHPERPASTKGEFNSVLAEEAESHSDHQANIRVQGHHNWNNRFGRINRRLSGSAAAQEVVAESWPGQHLVEAAVECVHSWRQSPGHWSAVRGRHSRFGYDIKRGNNGIWYATGIFDKAR
jgi:hypothetical protein